MHEQHTVLSVVLGKEKFMVTIYPNIDHAFIVAIIVILNEFNKNNDAQAAVQSVCLKKTSS
ncbi:hypothetical protein ACOSQ4_029515 [Xanthoceras sorbifolium]